MRALDHHRYTWRQYLALERDANLRHEFVDGQILAMAGGTYEHAALGSAVIAALSVQLKGRPCRVHTSDLRVRVPATGLATYPEVTVICGQPEFDPDSKDTVVNPVVLVEVLSESTEHYERGEKFENYKQLPSLQEYVLISTREQLIEVFRRGPENTWSRTEARKRASARLESISSTLETDAIYDGIDLERRGRS